MLMVIGACAGSTGGGMKCARVLLIFKTMRRNISQVLHPKKVKVIKPTESYDATVIGINDDFSLQIDRGGTPERLFTGEISIRI